MVEEMDYGHNPAAYLCSERPDDQQPQPHELCVVCADGMEALTWKRRAVNLRATMTQLAEFMERLPLSEREAGRIGDRDQAFIDAAAMIRLALTDES